MFRFGKLKAKIDPRTIRLKTILREVPSYPNSYHIDEHLPAPITEQLWGNDKWGDCVMVDRVNHTLRFECAEQNKQIAVTDEDVLNEYWAEQGWRPSRCSWFSGVRPKPDNGLVMLDSLNSWRKTGWLVGGRRYSIYAYASTLTEVEVKASIYLLGGVDLGIVITQGAMDQFDKGEPWDVIGDAFGEVLGGHAIYGVGYDEKYLYIVTWGKVQPMTWAFYHRYTDECYAAIDNADPSDVNPIDVNKLDELLKQITG